MQNRIIDEIHIKKVINLLYLHGEEMTVAELSKILDTDHDYIISSVPHIIERLEHVGLGLLYNNQKLCIVTLPDFNNILSDFTTHIINTDLTPAQLQTVTVVAYLGDVTISDISFVRGVQSSQTIRSLTTRGLLEKSKDLSKKDHYTITSTCLQHLGITRKEELKDYLVIQNRLRERIKEALTC